MSCSLTTAGLWAIALALGASVSTWYATSVAGSLESQRYAEKYADSWRVPLEVAHQVRKALDRKVIYE